MSFFTQDTLNDHLRGRDCIDWLQSRMEHQQVHPVQDLYERRMVHAQLLAVEVYHALAWFLQAYPQVKSVRPRWIPTIDEDDQSIIVRFRLDIASDDPADLEDALAHKQRAQDNNNPLLELYGYDEALPSMVDPAAYDTLIELGEGVGPETWNEFYFYSLADPKRAAYTSVVDIEKDMNEDLAPFLAELHQWLLNRQTPTTPQVPRTPRARL